jgi:diguanylate cyclase (GGDEF)-like protein
VALFGDHDIGKAEAELEQSREQDQKLGWLYGTPAIVALAALAIPERAISDAITENSVQRCLLTFLFALAVGVPILMIVLTLSKRTSAKTTMLMDSLRHDLKEAAAKAHENAQRRESQARRQEFETQLANALEMAAAEPEVVDVVERAFVATMGDAPTELLLADNSHAHLVRMATTGDGDAGPMCSVGSPDQCPAARRAQVQRFPDSEALDACPKLRGRAVGRCSAVCVPVSIMGRTVGVIHSVTELNRNLEDTTVQDLATLANLSGARVGLLRMMADTQLQAATDSLTGLLNRRSFENQVRTVRKSHPTMALVMADLDHFKELNDTYGHDTGDRALRLFAQTLRSSLRSEDVVCRYGGEEFAIALPSCSAIDAANMLEALRRAISSAVAHAGLPAYTASFGVVDVDGAEDLNDALVRADNALFESKVGGRDRVTIGAQGVVVAHRNDHGHSNANGNGRATANGNGISAKEPAEELGGVVVDS